MRYRLVSRWRPAQRCSTWTAPRLTSSASARSTVSVDDFLCNLAANVARAGIRAPVVLPYRSSTAYRRNAQSPMSASSTHSGTIENRSSNSNSAEPAAPVGSPVCG
jgi:hypothetical protein